MTRTIAEGLTKDTRLCLSLSGRPGNTGTRFHNYLYDALGLDFVYKAFTTTDIKAAVAGAGDVSVLGEHRGGVGVVSVERSVDGGDDVPELDLNLDLVVGNIEVRQ